MTDTPFEQAFEGFRDKLVELVNQRNAIQTRINAISHAMEAMAHTCENLERKMAYLDEIQSLTAQVGFQDAIRFALRRYPQGATAVQIRDLIATSNMMNLSAYSNPLASIYTTLRRMKENNEVEELERNGEKIYRSKIVIRPVSPTERPIIKTKRKGKSVGARLMGIESKED